MKKPILVFAIAAAVAGCGSSSQEKADMAALAKQYTPEQPALLPEEKNHYAQVVASFFRPLVSSGFSGGILVAKQGTIVYEHYTGMANHMQHDSITAETPLQIASTSKTFTGGAILQLIEDGKLALSDSLTELFPKFPYPGITVKMLLNHRSGLPNYLYYLEGGLWDKKKQLTNADVLNTLVQLKPPKAFNPNTRFQYCNTNYVLLALLIEKMSGMTYPEYMRKHFFEPLGMKNSFVYEPGKDNKVQTLSYNAGGGVWAQDYTDGPYGDKNIYSTPRDLLKWDQALYGNKLISKAMLDSAFTPYSNEKPGQHNYGLGFRLLLLPNGKRVVYHNGRWHGFNAAFSRLPDEKATIIILGNKYRSTIYTVARKAYNLFGDYDPGAKGFEASE